MAEDIVLVLFRGGLRQVFCQGFLGHLCHLTLPLTLCCRPCKHAIVIVVVLNEVGVAIPISREWLRLEKRLGLEGHGGCRMEV